MPRKTSTYPTYKDPLAKEMCEMYANMLSHNWKDSSSFHKVTFELGGGHSTGNVKFSLHFKKGDVEYIRPHSVSLKHVATATGRAV